MNIVHFEDEPWDSGLADYALTLAAEQARQGHRVAVWGLAGSPVLDGAQARGLAVRGWTKGPAGWSEIPSLRRALAKFAPDVIDAHTGSALSRALLLAPAGAAVVRTRGDARAPSANVLTRLTASRARVLIAANSTIQKQLQDAFPGRPVRLVPQGVEGPDEAAPMPGRPFLGVIARLDPVKGHETLIAAAKTLAPKIPGFKVQCAGDGKRREELERRVNDEGLNGTVHFLGRVADKWPFLSGQRIGVVPSTGSEAVSRAALEWMAAGRPVVASRVGGIPDLVEDGVTGLLVPPGDAGALTAALESLLKDPARAEAMGRAGRARWRSHFSPEPFFLATQKVYDEALQPLPR